MTDSHTPGLSATSARNETGRVVPRYYNATHMRASTTTTGALIPNRVVGGKRQYQMGHTVVLPRFGVEALTTLVAETGGLEGPVFANRDGGWMSLANMRRALRAAVPEDLAWVTPHSFRRTVATVVRDALGPAAAQQQLSHAKLATTEVHYLQRQTTGPDVRNTLDRFAAGESSN